MGDSYRIRTQVGINKTINVQLDQDYEFLEILSLKIQQSEIYNRNCSEYGVLVGRVTANNGLGIPNAKISLFIPIDSIDESNPIIQSIYPYKSPADKNEDGYRYNLLPYEKSYESHAATGTFPSRLDALTASTAVYIYDKYYKFTAKTNESGDYMIMGIPLGFQTIVMDVDLSDIGEFSLTPQDLIRMGLATETQVSGDRFRTSEDLNSLPQIINLTKSIDISPFWGDPTVCEIAVNRLDFDLRNEANIDIQPTAIFMGSIFSSPDNVGIGAGNSVLGVQISRPNVKSNLGDLCSLIPSPGQILAIRQTIQQDGNGNPILEQYRLEQSGNVIDGDGTWLIEIPMNLEYVITNEFGEKIISYDPSIGIPTKGKYRFKIKWQQSPTPTGTRRAYFLVPNVREYGWLSPNNDPNTFNNTNATLGSSYYFGLDWSGYTNGFFGIRKEERTRDIINCEDTFYEFNFNKVYSVSSLIDEYKSGSKSRFIGIKNIENTDCTGQVTTFPVNEGYRNFNLLYALFSLFSFLFYIVFFVIIAVSHVALGIAYIFTYALCAICKIEIPIINVKPFGFICDFLNLNCESPKYTVKLPMLTYPECSQCKCSDLEFGYNPFSSGFNGVLTKVSNNLLYYNKLSNLISQLPEISQEDNESASIIFSQAVAGNNNTDPNLYLFKTPKSDAIKFLQTDDNHIAYSDTLTLGERINLFNTRKTYFDNINKIGVTFASEYNPGKIHYDNTLTLLSDRFYQSGQLLTAVNPYTTSDLNSNVLSNGQRTGITGTTISQATTINVEFATSQLQNSVVQYDLPTGSTINSQLYPMDREYYQVITAITLTDYFLLSDTGNTQTFPNILNESHNVYMAVYETLLTGYIKTNESPYKFNPIDLIENPENQYVLILQRGVDPYSPKYVNQYQLGTLFGLNMNQITLTATTRINIPIQKLENSNRSVQEFNQNEMFYPSYFFVPGSKFSGFSSTSIGYYGASDAQYNYPDNYLNDVNLIGVESLVTKTSNQFYNLNSSSANYDAAEDLSSCSFIYISKYQIGFFDSVVGFQYAQLEYIYFSPNAYLYFRDNPLSLSDKSRNVMRTDRLPSSDQLNGLDWSDNPALLQQNNNFIFYNIPEPSNGIFADDFGTGFSQQPVDIEGLPDSLKVIETFNCQRMVDLDCYEGFGSTFRIKPSCLDKSDSGIFSQLGSAVQNGCYVFVRRPFFDLPKDFDNLAEYISRYVFTYGLCQNVISQSFTNNWINGSLFMFPIKVQTFFSTSNQPIARYPKEIVYFDVATNNFYYRSSPYIDSTNKFIGEGTSSLSNNERNLLFPTTIIDLGIKSSFYKEILFEGYAQSFVVPFLDDSSYGDNSQIINLAAISFQINSSWLKQIVTYNTSSIEILFRRRAYEPGAPNESPYERVNGNIAQLFSINSEIGVVKFSTEFYGQDGNQDAVSIFELTPGAKVSSGIGIWFSSTTSDLQVRDYLTPGSINFVSQNAQNSFNYKFGIKSQTVPFYRWKYGNYSFQFTAPIPANPNIFGTDQNDWSTGVNDIFSREYQSLDRTQVVNPGYFQSSTIPQNNLSLRRGYIFSTDQNGDYSLEKALYDKFLVGAPFHFYFGVKKGATAIDKFKSKYLSDE